MGVFKRLFKIGQAEAHSVVDKLENPIKMTEQGIRDMKVDLDKSLQALAEVKAMQIRAKRDAEQNKSKAEDYEKKAMAVLEKAKRGDMETAEADRLATEALLRKEEHMKSHATALQNAKKFESNANNLEANIKRLKSNISHWENELKTLKARVKVAESTKKMNKQLANIDSSSTINMLERMKEKVDKEEALSEAYADIANESKSIDDELDQVLEDESKVSASDALEELKKKMEMK